MTRVLAVSDEVEGSLYGHLLGELAPDVIVSCGDLPFDYLDYLVTVANVPLLWVPGNHDPSPVRERSDPMRIFQPGYLDHAHREPPGPPGGMSLDGRIVEMSGVRFAGLGGSMNYNDGPHQYTDPQMSWRSMKLWWRSSFDRAFGRGAIDVFVAHIPPAGHGDIPDDPAHRGAPAFCKLIARLRPAWMIHGHVHPHGAHSPPHSIGDTRIVNVVPYQLIEVET